MICVEPGLYVRVEQFPGRPHPLPLASGFAQRVAYRVLGLYSPSETSECYFVVVNDRDETWFISNRHFRVVGLFPERRELRFALEKCAVGAAGADGEDAHLDASRAASH